MPLLKLCSPAFVFILSCYYLQFKQWFLSFLPGGYVLHCYSHFLPQSKFLNFRMKSILNAILKCIFPERCIFTTCVWAKLKQNIPPKKKQVLSESYSVISFSFRKQLFDMFDIELALTENDIEY